MPDLFCFPYAGASPTVFQNWREALPALTVQYPAGAGSVEEVVQSLLETLAPRLRGQFAFFGHSMGAGIAFEFTRALRREGLPMPGVLFVSAATAPQLRTTIHADPTEEELLATLARIHGVAASEPMLRTLLARFEPDARLHRRYLYREEPPLDIPIRALGGMTDATVPLPRLEAWREQTTDSFWLRLFPGGHMYPDRATAKLLAALREDLHELLPG